MMGDLNESLERQIRENFRRWLVPSGGGGAGAPAPASGAPVRVTPLQ